MCLQRRSWAEATSRKGGDVGRAMHAGFAVVVVVGWA